MSKEKFNSFKTYEHWSNAKVGRMGATDITAILGMNPFKSPLMVYRELINGRDEQDDPNPAKLVGVYLEDGVARYWESVTHNTLIKTSTQFELWELPGTPIAGSPDRRYKRGTDTEKGVLEIKTTAYTFEESNLPPHWYTQLQLYLGLTGYKIGEVAWLELMSRQLKRVEYPFDQDFFDKIVNYALEWHSNYVVPRIEPEPVTVEDAKIKWPTHAPGSIIPATDDIAILIDNIIDLRTKIKESEDQVDKMKNDLVMFLRDFEAIERDGQIIVTYKASKASSVFDKDRFAKEHADLYKDYLIEKPGSRRMLFK